MREGCKGRKKLIKRVRHCKRVLPKERGREFLTDNKLRKQQDKSNRMKNDLAVLMCTAAKFTLYSTRNKTYIQ